MNKQEKSTQFVNYLLDGLKSALSISKDFDLAKALGISKATLSNWRSRGTMDYDLLFSICVQKGIDINVLITDAKMVTQNGNLDAKMYRRNVQVGVQVDTKNTLANESSIPYINSLTAINNELNGIIAQKNDIIAFLNEKDKHWKEQYQHFQQRIAELEAELQELKDKPCHDCREKRKTG